MPRLTARGGRQSIAPAAEASPAAPATGSGESAQGASVREVRGAPRLARAIVVAVLCSYVAVQVTDVVAAALPSRGLKLVVDVAALVGVFALTVSVTFAVAEPWSLRRRLATLLAQALITYLPLVVLGRYWAGMAGFFAGSALLLLPGWVGGTLFAGSVAGMLAVSLISHMGAYGTTYLTLSTLVVGLLVFGLARLSVAIRSVHAHRAELAQMAVISERTRFSRDLHDLLGYSLSAITMKAELTRRLVSSNPDRARDELAEVVDIARQALTDVRTVAAGCRNISLAKEVSSVTSLLTTAGMDVRGEVTCQPLDGRVDSALAIVLREAVTNILRHSAARNCVIEAEIADDIVRLLVRNDGAPPPAASGRVGAGLENLHTRLEAIGGKLTAEAPGDGWFSLLAEAPLQPATAHAPASGAGVRPPGEA
jgi:two-component system sensor histidine kinase DesK